MIRKRKAKGGKYVASVVKVTEGKTLTDRKCIKVFFQPRDKVATYADQPLYIYEDFDSNPSFAEYKFMDLIGMVDDPEDDIGPDEILKRSSNKKFWITISVNGTYCNIEDVRLVKKKNSKAVDEGGR